MFKSHISRLSLFVVSGDPITNLIEEHIQTLDADEFEFETPVAFSWMQNNLLSRFGEGRAPGFISVVGEGDQFFIWRHIDYSSHIGSVYELGRAGTSSKVRTHHWDLRFLSFLHSIMDTLEVWDGRIPEIGAWML